MGSPAKGWIIDPDVHGLFDGPDNTVVTKIHHFLNKIFLLS